VRKPEPSAIRRAGRAAPEHHLGELHLALDHGPVARAQRADRDDARAVLVTQRQVEEHVLHGAQAETLERGG